MSALQRLGIQINQHEQCTTAQEQTSEAFGFKWAKRDTYESDIVKEHSRKWLIERYCAGKPNKLNDWLSGDRKIIVDAGCGAGFSALLLFGKLLNEHDYLGIDISNAVNVARDRFAEMGVQGDFLQSDILQSPLPDNSVDMIFSEGVLHHTDNTQNAILHLAKKIKKDGRFLFYVYRKKSIIREFTDDSIRDQLASMTDEQAWEALKPLTKLGKVLGELNIDINIPEEVSVLGIPKGKMNLQRFFYWHICKAYYRDDYSLDEMNHVNFDWFRPLNCHRQTPDQVIQWCKEANLNIEHLDVQEAGISVVAVKE